MELASGWTQGRNHRENLGGTAPMVGRVKVSENSGATAGAPVAPVDTSLMVDRSQPKIIVPLVTALMEREAIVHTFSFVSKLYHVHYIIF